MALQLPEHPLADHPLLRPDPALVEALAAEIGDAGSLPALLFGKAPARLFDRVLGQGPDAVSPPSALWLLHVAGYFGGLWLRAALLDAQPEGPLRAMAATPDADAVAAVAESAAPGVAAASGSDADAVAFCNARLPDLVSAYGYNLGYLEQILAAPPEGSAPPPNYVRAEGPLWSELRGKPLACMDGLWSVARRVAEPPDPRWRDLVSPVAEAQAAAAADGHQVWTDVLTVAGLDAGSFRDLLTLSAGFLAAIQATALCAASAVGDERPDRGHAAALAQAMLSVWQGSYALGLRDPGHDATRPVPLPSLS